MRGDFQDLGDAYMFKEALRSIYRQSKDSCHARMAFRRWSKLAEETGIPELKTMAGTIRDKLDGIVTCWTYRHISNAKMEGFNNKIRWLIKQAYCFRDREYNKIENLSASGNFKFKGDMSLCHKPSKRLFQMFL